MSREIFEIHRFVNFKYLDTVAMAAPLMLAKSLWDLHSEKSDALEKTYTVLCEDRDLAFSQTCSRDSAARTLHHGNMWKHERGHTNPFGPDYNELLKILDQARKEMSANNTLIPIKDNQIAQLVSQIATQVQPICENQSLRFRVSQAVVSFFRGDDLTPITEVETCYTTQILDSVVDLATTLNANSIEILEALAAKGIIDDEEFQLCRTSFIDNTNREKASSS